MIQNRRHSRHKFGSTKSNKTFDKHNGIKRVKDEDDNLVANLKKLDLATLIKEAKENA